MVVKLRHCLVKMTLCDIASQRIQGLLETYFEIKSMVSNKRCEGGIEKSVSQNHCLASLDKPHDAKQ